MTAITLTTYPALAAVLIQVTAAPAGPLVIERLDANGTRPVRLLAGQAPIAGVLTVYDYEPALTGTVTYTADGATATVSNVAPAGPVVASAVMPAARHRPAMVLDVDEQTRSGSTVHDPIDRPDPIVIYRDGQSATGRFTTLEISYTDAALCRSVLLTAGPVLLRQPTYPGLDRYAAILSASIRHVPDDLDTRPWLVEVEYRVVDPPTDPLAGAAGWDFAALADGYATFTAAKAAFATFAGMTIGP